MNVSTRISTTATIANCQNTSINNSKLNLLAKPALMMRWFFILLTFVSVSVNVNAQTLANYTFSSSTTASLTDMTSGTTPLVGLETGTYRASVASAVTNMPFPFLFMGALQTQFSCNSNGQMRFGSTVIGTSITIPAAGIPYLCPMAGANATSATGVVHYKVTGTYPARVMTIAWDSLLIPANATAAILAGTVQARLYEGSGVVEFVYGMVYNNSASAQSRSIFLGSSNTATTNGYVTVGATPTFTLAAANVTNSFAAGPSYIASLSNNTDGSRYMYSFTPVNTMNGPSSLNFTNVATASMTLNWTVPVVTTGILGYAIAASTDGGNTYNLISSVAGSATATANITGLTPNTSYLWQVYSYNEGAISSTSASGNQATNACSISGTKSVGPTGIYTSLTAALADIKLNGVTGPVILELQSTYVSTVETFPVTLNAIPCASAINTITIRPETGATGLDITSSNTTATLNIDGGNYYILDGRPGGTGSARDLKVTNTSAATGGTAIRFINEASNNSVKYCVLRAAFGSTTSGIMNFAGTTGTNGNDNNTIDNNDFDGQAGATASPTTGVQVGIYSAGGTLTTAQNSSGNILSNNNFKDIFRTGATITLHAINITTGNAEWTITGNSIYQTATRTSTVGAATVNGIVIATPGGPGNNIITNNFIGGSAPSAGSTAWTMTGAFANRFQGLNLIVSSTAASTVSGNTIANMNWSSTSGATTLPGVWAGININSTCGAINVTGNTIGGTTGTGSVVCTISTTGGISVGIGTASTATANINISNNNVGSVTVAGSAVGISHSFLGIFNSAALVGSLTISGNTVGSASTANSIQYSTAGTGTTGAVLSGILSSGAPTLGTFITGNTVANFNNAYVPAATYTTSSVMRGIWVSSGIDSIAGNTVRNFTTAANATGTGASASIMGIGNASATAGANYIRANTVHSLSNNNSTTAVYVTGIYYNGPTTGGIIDRNLVHSLNSPSVVSQINGINAGGQTTVYRNNMIRLGSDAAGAAITTSTGFNGILETAGTNSFYHNTVMIEGAGVNTVTANTYAFNNNVLLTGARDIRNNIFINNRSNATTGGKHYAVRVGGTTTLPTGLTLNYNLYRATGTGGTFGFYNSLDVANLAAWQAAVGLDANSIATDPCIIAQTGIAPDLHLTDCAGAGSPADGAGINLSVADDYDAQTRSLLTPTDIGADAGNYGVIGVDVGISALLTPAVVTGCLTATEAVTVTLTNFGVNTIDFSVNPVTITVTATGGYSDTKLINTGTLVSNGSQNELMALTIDMTGNGTYVFTSTATVTGDVQNANNTNITNRTVVSIGGTYNVGAGQAPAGFNTLTAAVAAYNSATCISGPVVFNLMDLTYNTSETFPIIINANAAAGTNTLTIKPNAAGTVIAGTLAGNSLIRLNGADYVIIDGSTSGGTDQSLTITNAGTTTLTSTVSMVSLGTALGATNNTIKNCIITGGSSAVATYGISVGGATAGTAGSDNDNVTIQNNTISAVANGISALGNASVSATGMDNLTVVGNTITTSTSIATLGIRVGNGLNCSVSQNTISVEQTSTGAPTAISLETGFVSSSVTRNNITRAKAITTGGYGGRGISIGTATATSNLTIANNFISGVTGDNFTSFGNSSSMGIAIGMIGAGTVITTLAGGLNIYHNTINMYDAFDAARASLSAGIYVGTGASAIDLRNNIIVNTMNNINVSGTASKAYAIYSAAANTAFTNINYNDYYVSGAQGILCFLTADQTTLAGLQTAFGGNANSSNIAPVFTSASNLHMNISNNPTLENTGGALAAVTNDYDNDARSATTPDMGADEWSSPVGIDVGATTLVLPTASGCYTTAETVTVRVKNHSNNTAINFTTDPVTLTVTATGGYSQVIVIDGAAYGPTTLAAQATTDITLPATIDMSVIQAYTFNAATSIPVAGPGGADINATNDAMAPVIRTGVAPAVGTVSANPAGGYCVTGGTPTLTLSSAAGGTIQWQESIVSSTGPWTNVGTNALTYTPGSAITATTYYQATVTCAATTVTSNVVTVTLSNPLILTTTPGSRCGIGTVELCATGSAGVSFNWYSAATGGVALSNPYSNIPITAGSFNNDIVANGIGTNSIVGTTYPAIGLDGQLYTFIDNTFQYVSTNALPTCFMPTNNQITSLLTPSLTYQLQSYTASNAISISNSSTTYTNPLPATRTMTLTTAASYGTLKVLYESVVTVGSLTVDAVVTFTDATTQTFNGNSCVNWFTAGSTAFRNVGRTTPTGGIECGSSPNFFPNLFELSLAISPANYAKQVASITFSIPTVMTTGTTPASVNYFHAMALGGNAPSTGCFTTPSISANTTYYVAAASGNGSSQVSNHGVPNVSTSTQNSGVLFTLNTGVTLNSIDVYSLVAGTATVTLLNSALQTVFTSSAMPIVASTLAIPQTLSLGWTIPAGVDYRILVSNTGNNLGYHTGTFPIAMGNGVGTVTNGATATGTTTLNYFVYNMNTSIGCESARTAVVATVTAPPPLTSATATPSTICLGQSSTLQATSANANYTYVWTPGNLANGASVSPTTTTTYTVTATDNVTTPGSPCVISDVATVTVNPVPSNVIMSPTAATVCVGGNVTLNATSGQNVSGVVGAGGTSSLGGTTGNPYRSGYGSTSFSKSQMLVLASELTGLGFQAGNITSLGFTVTSISTTTVTEIYNLKISLANTALTVLTATGETAIGTLVYTDPGTFFTPVVGVNTHTFQTPFVWDGSSNVLVTVCQNLGTPSTTTTVGTFITTGIMNTQAVGTTVNCETTTAMSTATSRPIMTIGGNTAAPITWSPATDLNTTSGNTVISTPTSTPITYTATATLGSCTKINTVTVTLSDLAVSAVHTNVLCFGGSTGTITATATGGTAPYTYSINGTTFQSSNVFNVVAGTYTIYVKDASVPANCTVSGNTVVVTQPAAALSSTITGSTAPTCNSGSLNNNSDGTVTAVATDGTGPYTYVIAGPTVNNSGLNSGVFTGLTAGSYTVTATDFNGCTAISTAVVLNDPAAPAITATNNGPICAGQNATLTATPNTYVSYAWTGPGTINNANTDIATAVTPANNDVFTVLITDALGCTNTATTTVTVVANAAVSVVLGVSPSNEVCAGSTITFTATPTNGGGVPNYQFFVNSGAGPVSVQNGTSATYITTTLADQDVVTVVMTSSITCTTGSPATSNAITMTVSSNVFADVAIAASPSGTVCSGTSVTYTATPTAGGPAPTYEFFVNSGAGDVSVQNSSSTTYTYIPANGDIIYVIMTSSFDCALGSPATSPSITMAVTTTPAAPTITAGGPTTFCNGGSVTLSSSYTGTGNQWYMGTTLWGEQPDIVVTTSGSYTVVYTSGGCPSPASNVIVVTVNANPVATITGTASFCTGSNTTLSAATSTAGSGTITGYQWVLNGVTNLGTAVTEVISTAGSYTVIVTNSNGCSTTSAATVVAENASPTASVTGDNQLCTGTSSTLDASASTAGSGTITTYQWVLNGSTNVGTNSATYTTNVAGSYTVIVTNSNGCSTTSAAFILNAIPTTPLSGNYTINSTLPASCTNYLSFALAISDLNTRGVSANVLFDVNSGHTETAPTGGLLITYCGLAGGIKPSATQTVSFQGGATAATITAPVGSTTTLDAIITLSGADWITFDKVNIQESAANTTPTTRMEFGYALFKCDGNNGSNHNTISNCSVTLTKAYNISQGIYSQNHTPTSTTLLTYTGTAGDFNQVDSSRSGYNRFISNSIQNVYFGIVLNGNPASSAPHSLNDTLNFVGMAGQGNTITNFGGLASNTVAIAETNQRGFRVNSNTINGGTGTTLEVTGIRMNSGVWGEAINNSITLASSTTTSAIIGLNVGFNGGDATNPNLVTITGNTVQNYTNTAATSSAFTGITSGSGGTGAIINISNNSVLNNVIIGTGAFTGITSNATAASITMNNNIVQNNSNASTGTFTSISQTTSPTNLTMNGNSITGNTKGSTGTWTGLSFGLPANGTINNNTVYNNQVTGGAATVTMNCAIGSTSVYTFSGNTIRKNRVLGMAGTSIATVVGYTNSGSPTNETITNNLIDSLWVTGAATPSTGIQVVRGIINNTTSAAGAIRNVGSNIIRDLFTSSNISGGITGITSNIGNTVNMYKNKIYNLFPGQNGTSAAFAKGITNISALNPSIYNNYIGLDLTGAAAATGGLAANSVLNTNDAVKGIEITAGTTVKIYNNTIRLAGNGTGTAFGSSAIGLTSTTPAVDIRNNIIENLLPAGGLAAANISVGLRRTVTIAANTTGYAATSNNNIWYLNGANTSFYYDGTTSYPVFANFLTQAGVRETNSKTENVTFISTNGPDATYLHVDAVTPTFVEGGAQSLASVTDDYDGDIRNLSIPDIGADEINGTPVPCTGAVGGIVAFPNAKKTVCAANSTATFAPSGYSTGGGISYQWMESAVSDPTGATYTTNVTGGTGGTTPSYTTAANLAPGTYYYILKVTCSTGPVTAFSNEDTVVVNPNPTAAAANNGPMCSGASLTLTGTTDIGTTFAWSGPNGFTSTLQSPTVPAPFNGTGTYTFTATANGCSTSATTAVTITNTPPPFTINPPISVFCEGGSTTLTAGGVSGSTEFGTGTTSMAGVTGYPYRSGSTLNSINKVQTLILASELTTAGYTAGNITALAVRILTVSAATTMFNRSIRMANTSVSALTATYETNLGTQVFNDPNPFVVATGPVVIANAFDIDHPFSTPFTWDGTSNVLITFCSQQPSTALTTIGCEGTSTSPTILNTQATPTTSVDCITTTVSTTTTTRVNYTLTFDLTPSNVTWSPATGLNTTTGPVVIASPTVPTIYTATSTNGSCTSSATAQVLVNPLPAGATVSGTTSVCLGAASPLITFSANVGTGPYTFTYNINGGTDQTVTTGSGANPLSVTVAVPTGTAGTFTYNLTAISDIYCANTATGSATVTVNPLPTAPTGTDVTVCYDALPHTGSATAPSGSSVVWYTASTGGSVTTAPTGTAAGIYTAYAASADDITGCESATRTLVTVTINELPTVSFSGLSASICLNGGLVTLTGSPVGGTFSGTGISGNTFNPATAGIGGPYTITYSYTDGNGCTATSSQTVTVTQILDYANLQFPSSGIYCAGGSLTAYGQVYEAGLTDPPGQAAGISVDLGYNTTNTDPATWTNWSPATFNVQVGNNDEYSASLSLPAGTYYYTFRYSLNGCAYQYGGYSAGGGNFWDGTNFVSGVLTVNALPTVSFSGLGATYCTTDAAVTLTGSPVGGTFSGPGITGNSFDPATAGVGTHTITYNYTDPGTGCSNSATQQVTVSVCPTGVTVNLKVWLQGYYIPGGSMQPVLANQSVGASATDVDDVTIELHDATTYALVGTAQTAVLQTSGLVSATFTEPAASYYVVVKHRNTIQTWSANPIAVTGSTPLYNFTSGAAQAAGSNQTEVETGVWAMYTGDINQDDFIDSNDFTDLDTDIFNGVALVYVATDLNGDGFVDSNDFTVIDANIFNGVAAAFP